MTPEERQQFIQQLTMQTLSVGARQMQLEVVQGKLLINPDSDEAKVYKAVMAVCATSAVVTIYDLITQPFVVQVNALKQRLDALEKQSAEVAELNARLTQAIAVLRADDPNLDNLMTAAEKPPSKH